MIDLEKIINKKPINSKNCIAKIDESQCIGCTKCIKSCPFDAIIGTAKLMHSILADECTGCGFCIEPCPVDCISMIEISDKYLPRNPFLSNNNDLKTNCENHAKLRFDSKKNRLNQKNQINYNFDIKDIITNAKNKKQIKYEKIRVDCLDKQLEQQIILQQKQKSLKRKQNKLKNNKNV